MEAVNIKISLKKGDSELKYTKSGQYDSDSECLFFKDTADRETSMRIYFKEKILERETEETLLTIPFDTEKETLATLELFGYEKSIFLRIKTELYKYEKRKLVLKYQLLDQEEIVEYKIEF